MKLKLSNVQFEDPGIQGLQGFFISMRYRDTYVPILPEHVDTTLPIPFNLSANQEVEIDIVNDIFSDNCFVSVDLLALAPPPKAKPDEYSVIPLKNQKMNLHMLFSEMCSKQVQTQDICLPFQLETIVTDIPDYFPGLSATQKSQTEENAQQEQPDKPPVQIYATVTLSEIPFYPKQIIKIIPKSVFTTQAMFTFQDNNQVTMSAQLIVNGKTIYELNGGRVVEIAAIPLQEIRLNDDISTAPQSNYQIQFPAYSMKSLNYKQFQTIINNFVTTVQAVFEPDKNAAASKDKKKPAVIKGAVEILECFSLNAHQDYFQEELIFPAEVMEKYEDTINDPQVELQQDPNNTTNQQIQNQSEDKKESEAGVMGSPNSQLAQSQSTVYPTIEKKQVIQQIKIIMEPRISLITYPTSKDKAGDKKPAQLYFGVARSQFNAGFDKQVLNMQDTRLFGSFGLSNDGLVSSQQISGTLIPYDKRVHESFFNENQLPKEEAAAKESRKFADNIDYKEGQIFNRVYSNVFCGIQLIQGAIDGFDYASSNMPPLSSKSAPILDIFNNYLNNRTEYTAVDEFYNVINKINNYPLAFGQTTRLFTLPGVDIEVKTDNPLIYVQAIKVDDFKTLPEYEYINDQIRKHSNIIFNDQNQLVSYEPINQEDMIQDEAQNMLQFVQARQQQLLTQSDYKNSTKNSRVSDLKALNLKGIQGIQTQLMMKVSKKGDEERLDFDYDKYKEQLQGDGIVTIFVRQFTQAMRDLVGLGFSSESEVVNYYKNLANEVVLQLHNRYQVMVRQNTRLKLLEQRGSAGKECSDTQNSLSRLKSLNSHSDVSLDTMDRGGKPRSNESMLLERGTITHQQKKFMRLLREQHDDIILLTATNQFAFLQVVEQLSSALYSHYEELDEDQTFEDALDLFQQIGVGPQVADIIMCRLIAGMKIAQPMDISSIKDFECYERGITLLTGFLKRLLQEEQWLSIFGQNQQLCLLASAILSSELMIQRPMQLKDQIGVVDTPERFLFSVEIKATRGYTPKLFLDPAFLHIFNPLIKDSGIARGLLFNALSAGEQGRGQENKMEILKRYENSNFYLKDILLYFEIIDLLPQMPDKDLYYNGFMQMETYIKPKKEENKDSKDKKMGSMALPQVLKKSGSATEEKKEENPGIELLRTALNRPANYTIRQPGPEVIAAYLYVMYRNGILNAESVSKLLKQSQLDLVQQTDQKFKTTYLDEEEEIHLNMKINNSSDSNESPAISMQINPTISTVSGVFQNQKKFNQLIKVISERKRQTVNQVSMQHLTATQEHFLQGKFDLSSYVFQISSFESEEAYMEAFIGAFQHKPGPTGKCWLLVNLAEFLVRRNEKLVARETLKLIDEMMQRHSNGSGATIDVDQLQDMKARVHFLEIMILKLEKKYVEAMDELDKIRDNVNPVLSQRIKTYPMYHLVRGCAYHYMSQDPELSPEERDATRVESTKAVLYAVSQLQRCDPNITCTATGEAGFTDLAFGWRVCEVCMVDSLVTRAVVRLGDLEAQAFRAEFERVVRQAGNQALAKLEETPVDSHDLLRAQINQKYLTLYTAQQAKIAAGGGPAQRPSPPNSSMENSSVGPSTSMSQSQTKFGLFNAGGGGGIIGQALANSGASTATTTSKQTSGTPKQVKLSTKAVGSSGGQRTFSGKKSIKKPDSKDGARKVGDASKDSKTDDKGAGDAAKTEEKKKEKTDPFAEVDPEKMNAMLKSEADFKKKGLLEDVLEDGDVNYISDDELFGGGHITENDHQLISLADVFRTAREDRSRQQSRPGASPEKPDNKSGVSEASTSRGSQRGQGSRSVKAIIAKLVQGGGEESGVDFDRAQQKQLSTLTGACRSALEHFPSFGPLWGILSIAQLAAGAQVESRFSASLATLMQSYMPQAWLGWAFVQGIAQQDEVERVVYREIVNQLHAMGAQNTSWSHLWKFIQKFYSVTGHLG